MKQYKHVKLGYKYDLNINHELHQMLDYGGDVCNNSRDYSKDLCIDKEIEKESLEKMGCVTPFGPNKTHLCAIIVRFSALLQPVQTKQNYVQFLCDSGPLCNQCK